MSTPVRSVIATNSNADLIAEIAPLWIGDTAFVFDATYGKGNWWTKHQPPGGLKTNDLNPTVDATFHFDFREFPRAMWGAYDVVAFDPPYIAKGGRETSGIKDFDARYGLHGAPKDPLALWEFIAQGMASCAHLLAPRGRLLVKCMDYISSGRYQFGLGEVVRSGEDIGLRLVDLFIHARRPGPQPLGRRQAHSRRSHSYLVVLQKAAR